MICKICKTFGKQGEIFIVESTDPLSECICAKCYQPERLSEETAIYKGILPDCLNWCNPTTSGSDSLNS